MRPFLAITTMNIPLHSFIFCLRHWKSPLLEFSNLKSFPKLSLHSNRLFLHPNFSEKLWKWSALFTFRFKRFLCSTIEWLLYQWWKSTVLDCCVTLWAALHLGPAADCNLLARLPKSMQICIFVMSITEMNIVHSFAFHACLHHQALSSPDISAVLLLHRYHSLPSKEIKFKKDFVLPNHVIPVIAGSFREVWFDIKCIHMRKNDLQHITFVKLRERKARTSGNRSMHSHFQWSVPQGWSDYSTRLPANIGDGRCAWA